MGAGFAVVLDHFEEELVVFDGVGDGEEGNGVAGDAAGDFAEGEGGFVGVGFVGHDVGLHAVVIEDGRCVGLKVPHDANGLEGAVIRGEPEYPLPLRVGEGVGRLVGAGVEGVGGRRVGAGGVGDLGGRGEDSDDEDGGEEELIHIN